jgi:hypothetical protein
MIRIDEIYNNTFWPYIEQNRPGTRVFFCDPPGRTDPEHLFNLGTDDVIENSYVFMHDQEPVDLELFRPLFDEAFKRNVDLSFQVIPGYPPNSTVWPTDHFRQEYLRHLQDPDNAPYNLYSALPEQYRQWYRSNPAQLKNPGHVIVSERGESVEQMCEQYMWTAHYYFYHGWACMDWFRGYDQTYLIARARDRKPTRTFMSPNRIVAGKRDHRVLFLYNVFKNGLENNHISAPRTCQYEGVDISVIASKYNNTYPDIEQVFETAELPRLFAGEDTQLMHSYQLGNFAEAADSMIYVPTETVYFGSRTHLTEKTFKAIALEMPFVLVAPAHSLRYLREYGFRTFAPYIDESYDTITDDIKRIEAVTEILLEIQARSAAAKNQLWQQLLPIVEHNYNHFYRGGFRDILEVELKQMLKNLCGAL